MTDTHTTTLNHIRAHGPCESGWRKLLTGLGKTQADDDPLPYARIAEINGLDDALWCCRVEPKYDATWRLFTVWCARQVQHLMKDPRSLAALDVAERFARGEATEQELAAAGDAARAAAGDAARAARAAGAAGAAVRDAEWAAAGAAEAAARDAAEAVAEAAAGAAAEAAAGDAWAAWAAARDAQRARFINMVNQPPQYFGQ